MHQAEAPRSSRPVLSAQYQFLSRSRPAADIHMISGTCPLSSAAHGQARHDLLGVPASDRRALRRARDPHRCHDDRPGQKATRSRPFLDARTALVSETSQGGLARRRRSHLAPVSQPDRDARVTTRRIARWTARLSADTCCHSVGSEWVRVCSRAILKLLKELKAVHTSSG